MPTRHKSVWCCSCGKSGVVECMQAEVARVIVIRILVIPISFYGGSGVCRCIWYLSQLNGRCIKSCRIDCGPFVERLRNFPRSLRLAHEFRLPKIGMFTVARWSSRVR